MRRPYPTLLLGILFVLQTGNVQAQDLIWARRAGGASTDSGLFIAVDASGNTYVTGNFQGSATFGEGEANQTILDSVGPVDLFVAKYSATGSLLWAKSAGGTAVDQGLAIAVDDSGNSYVTGLFEGIATFGTTEVNETILTSTGSRDIYVAKFGPSGSLLWATQAGGSDSNDHAEDIVVDATGHIFVTGFYNESTTFGLGETYETTLISSGSFDIFAAKFDADGSVLWAKGAGGSSFDIGAGIAVDASGNSYVTGFFEALTIFGTGEANETTLISTNARDLFVAK